MTMHRALSAAIVLWLSLWGVAAAAQETGWKLDCARQGCAAILPGAERFEPVKGAPFVAGYDGGGELVGWVGLSTELVDIKAYSGKPLVTLVGLDKGGLITGAKVIHHSEPILLVGIPETTLDVFSAFYVGRLATDRVVVGKATGEGVASVDAISGATVTALAENQTILETARTIGAATGVIDLQAISPGHFVEEAAPWSWARLEQEKVFGRLTVSEKDMGEGTSGEPFVDLWFTVADAPQVGRALLGDGDYDYLIKRLVPGEHLVVVLGNGSSSFKGSAFVRGGIFDRVRVEQGLRQLSFRGVDYTNVPRVRAEGAPRFREGAAFIARGGLLDPGAPFSLIFLGSRYDHKGAFSREFREFRSEHVLPPSVYALEQTAMNEAIYVQAWRNHEVDAIVLIVFLLLVMGVFAGRRFTTSHPKVLKVLHLSTMAVSFGMVGVTMRAQPSITQILTLFDALLRDWRWELFLSEPLIFILWIFVAVVSVVWGRGVFCGWVCPYGAMLELVNKLAQWVKIPQVELPEWLHSKLRYLRYVVLAVLVPVFLYSSVVGEQLAEVEPFKSTFLVPAWERPWGFLVWWVLLLVTAVFMYRPFCRYICPLGAGLALFGSFRLSGPYRRKFCARCTICTKGCEPRAIRPDGTIDPRECLSCMECEVNYRDDEVCPPLVGIAKLQAKGALSDPEKERLARLWQEFEDV